MTDNFDWTDNVDFAVTVCDTDGNVIYRNNKSASVFAKYGEIEGKNLRECHSKASWDKIINMLSEGSSNTYTIEKGGIKKLIHQSPWRRDGKIAGLVEISVILPENMPNFKRD